MTELDEMGCQELVERVTEYLDAALSADDRSRFEEHVGECPGCEEILAQFRAVVATTGALRADDAAAVDPAAAERLLTVFRAWRAERP
ncbi:MAG: anti-sigma factor family protein [Acidimicrobiia bacterium]